MSDKNPTELAALLDRAIVLCDKFTPVNDRNPIGSGGTVRATAVALLVAARSVVEAYIEHEAKNPTEST